VTERLVDVDGDAVAARGRDSAAPDPARPTGQVIERAYRSRDIDRRELERGALAKAVRAVTPIAVLEVTPPNVGESAKRSTVDQPNSGRCSARAL
jgi:hypothetical protein